jgi:hypothetical protein
VTAQNIADRLIGDTISQVGERPDNPVIAPGPIFLRHPHNQFRDFFVDSRSTWASMRRRAIPQQLQVLIRRMETLRP